MKKYFARSMLLVLGVLVTSLIGGVFHSLYAAGWLVWHNFPELKNASYWDVTTSLSFVAWSLLAMFASVAGVFSAIYNIPNLIKMAKFRSKAGGPTSF